MTELINEWKTWEWSSGNKAQGKKRWGVGHVKRNIGMGFNEKVSGPWYPGRRDTCSWRIRSSLPRAGLGQSARLPLTWWAPEARRSHHIVTLSGEGKARPRGLELAS